MPRLRPLAAALIGTLTLPGAAWAGSLTVSPGVVSLDGEHTYSTIVVSRGGTLAVRTRIPLMDGDAGSGRLHLRANLIRVEAGGTIQAIDAGYLGKASMNGEGEAAGFGLFGMNDGDPGGGGAYFGAGGPGTGANCMPIAGSAGGVPYPTLLTFGSAGGAANTPGEGQTSRGGHGAGVLILEAARIEILGTLDASGGPGLSAETIGSGAGAGGLIQIITSDLVVGAETRILAVGGKGGTGAAHGGGGGGGRIVFDAPDPGTPFMVDARGGPGGGSCGGNVGWGGDGEVGAFVPPPCLDADQDSHTAAACGGDDCDDGDANVYPGAAETCNGVDDNCQDLTDDEQTSCPAPQMCSMGACVDPVDAGVDAGDPTAPIPDQIKLSGGCGVGAPRSDRSDRSDRSGVELLPFAAALVAFGLRRARRRRI